MLRAIEQSAILATLAALALAESSVAEEPPLRMSAYAPADVLMRQVDYYVDRLETSLGKATYSKASKARVAKDAQALVVLFLALGTHDEKNRLKTRAPGLVHAAAALVVISEHRDLAKLGLAELKQALTAMPTAPEETVAWDPELIDLHKMMKQVSTVSGRLRRSSSTRARFFASLKELEGYAALLATMGHAATFKTDRATNKKQIQVWRRLAGEMRDSAGAVRQAIAQRNFAMTVKEVAVLRDTCTNCHAVFRPALVGPGSALPPRRPQAR